MLDMVRPSSTSSDAMVKQKESLTRHDSSDQDFTCKTEKRTKLWQFSLNQSYVNNVTKPDMKIKP